MNVTLKISHVGKYVGTVGWMSENAGEIKIVPNKYGKPIAILNDQNGKRLCFLAKLQGENEEYDGSQKTVVKLRNGYDEYYPCTSDETHIPGLYFTDSAWAKIMELTELAIEELKKIQ